MTSSELENTLAMDKVRRAIEQRKGSTFPSVDVQNAALALLKESPTTRGISQLAASARVYSVERGGRRYLVVLYLREHGPAGESWHAIIDAECTCPAGEARKTCKHLLAVLTRAARDGLNLEV